MYVTFITVTISEHEGLEKCKRCILRRNERTKAEKQGKKWENRKKSQSVFTDKSKVCVVKRKGVQNYTARTLSKFAARKRVNFYCIL